jgi:hypothetical protein
MHDKKLKSICQLIQAIVRLDFLNRNKGLPLPLIKAVSGEAYTQFTGLFAHFLLCQKDFITSYAPFLTP